MAFKPILIYNPTAGKGYAAKNLANVEALLQKRNFDYDLVLTERPGHAQELSWQAAQESRSLVVAAGGDGTVNEVVNGLMQFKNNGRLRPAMGVLPVGRGNDFTFGVNIPQPLIQACDTLTQGHQRTIDLGRVRVDGAGEERYFCNGVGLGFDTVVGFEAAKMTWLRGAAPYLVSVIKTIFLYARAPVYEIVIDGVRMQRAFLMVSIMNGRRLGGAFLIAPDGNPGDGNFDLCLARQVNQLKILPLAVRYIQGTHTSHPAIQTLQGRQIHIRAVEGSIPAHADGETLCTQGRSLTIDLCPGALQVVTPLFEESL